MPTNAVNKRMSINQSCVSNANAVNKRMSINQSCVSNANAVNKRMSINQSCVSNANAVNKRMSINQSCVSNANAVNKRMSINQSCVSNANAVNKRMSINQSCLFVEALSFVSIGSRHVGVFCAYLKFHSKAQLPINTIDKYRSSPVLAFGKHILGTVTITYTEKIINVPQWSVLFTCF